MDLENIHAIIDYLHTPDVTVLDLTGGAPELNPHFRELVLAARKLDITVIDRCNLTILEEPGQEDLAQFLADNNVQVTASLPCYTKENVDTQRGKGVFEKSIRGLQLLNRLGYAKEGSNLDLDLVYNPAGAQLPPSQAALELDYKKQLFDLYGIEFTRLLTLANMPIKRFGSTLISKGEFHDYMSLLQDSHKDENLKTVMCKNIISVDWQGYVYDCDFNQMLNLPMKISGDNKTHLKELHGMNLSGLPIVVKGHCYGCTAGQGSSCGGALS